MKLHQYTSIETLEKILESQSIKFNRLDQVDDKSEWKHDSFLHDVKTKLGRYSFVSCWNKQEIENIDLWNRYGDNNKGVRITLDDEMFVIYNVGTVNKSFFNNRNYIQSNYLISSYINDTKPFKVHYVKDIIPIYNDAIQNIGNFQWIKTDTIGIYKKKEWQLQEEYRFIIHAQPLDLSITITGFDWLPKTLGSALVKNIKLNDKCIFIKLLPEVLYKMEVTLGPKCTEEDRLKVQNILNRYNINTTLKESNLKDDI